MESTSTTFFGRTRVFLAAICIAMCILLLAMWVRSHFWLDHLTGPQSGSYRPGLSSTMGWLTIQYRNDKLSPQHYPKWTITSSTHEAMEAVYDQMEKSIENTPGATFIRPSSIPDFHVGWTGDGKIRTPYWLATAILGCSAIVLGYKQDWRISLKTTLLMTAAIAVLIAIAVSVPRFFDVFRDG